MRKWFLILLFGLMAIMIGLGIANANQIRTIRVGMDLRMVVIVTDNEGTHFQYFTEPRAGEAPKLKGEEIFKDGQKVFDNYREND